MFSECNIGNIDCTPAVVRNKKYLDVPRAPAVPNTLLFTGLSSSLLFFSLAVQTRSARDFPFQKNKYHLQFLYVVGITRNKYCTSVYL